ncbi:MAG: class I adenylate cyclase, partial [Deltaproteobacteria bacterium]|nr:class I adenylate cyclase [Deltaproteobacteria bacterium]
DQHKPSISGSSRLTSDVETKLSHAKRVFNRYMAKKIDFLYELLPPRKRLVYDLIPLLLHLDAAELLDSSDACSMSPHGIFSYEPGMNTMKSFAEAFPKRTIPKLRLRASFDPSLPIKSLSLIGSLGSIAQNQKSDFDYWICYDAELFSQESFRYFQEKIRAIENWAAAWGGAEVHFFPLELEKVRIDDFGATRGESSGTALGKLLKEEYYRSMTLVAGQTPLWWIMPPGISDEEYTRLAEVVNFSQWVDSYSLLDMGNVKHISLSEFYGAAIWQINKTMGSPFKSILKLALLEEYMFDRGSKGLLCSELKQRLLDREEEIALMDPYVLMFERASSYLAEQGRHDDVDLLRRSLYLKAGVQLTLADHRRTDLPKKKQVMVYLVRQWGWNQRVIDELNNYQNWNFRQSLKFSQESNSFIMRTYKNVTAELND